MSYLGGQEGGSIGLAIVMGVIFFIGMALIFGI